MRTFLSVIYWDNERERHLNKTKAHDKDQNEKLKKSSQQYNKKPR